MSKPEKKSVGKPADSPAAPAAPEVDVKLSAVPSSKRLGSYLVTSHANGRELARDTIDLNLDKARSKFVRETLKAAFPGMAASAWPDALRTRLRQELLVLAGSPPGTPEPPADGSGPIEPGGITESGYAVIDGCTYQLAMHGPRVVGRTKLSNFVARIVAEFISDDGAEQTRELVIAATVAGGCEATACVPVDRFLSLDWVVERFGPRYIIQPGKGTADRLRCAIQEMSGKELPTAVVYRHTGWREIEGQFHYLHAGAPVAPVAPVAGIGGVRLDGAAAHYCLPPAPTGKSLLLAIRASLRILDGLIPDIIAFPLLATVYRAPLGSADYALWLEGSTGVQKSELAALAQQHYGAGMTRGHLPGNWGSTDNALELLAFTVKDAIFVIDDFAPSASRNDADRQHRVAERLIRGQGNHAGRQRMDSKANLRPAKPPRGLIVATGEDVPRVQSIAARLVIAGVRQGDVNLTMLSRCQADAAAGLYAAAMSGYTAWLAPQFAEVRAALAGERVAFRDRFVGRFPHARTPDTVANLLLGLHYLLRFAVEAGAIAPKRRDELWDRGQRAFLEIATRQAEHHASANPVARFPEMLAAIISSGRGYLANTDGRHPTDAVQWGWEERDNRYHPRGSKLGWINEGEIYLSPDSVYAALSELTRAQGQHFPLSQQSLFKRLKEAGHLLRTDGDRTLQKVTVEGKRPRLAILRTSYLSGTGATGATGADEPDDQDQLERDGIGEYGGG